jgi:hypothetical protein
MFLDPYRNIQVCSLGVAKIQQPVREQGAHVAKSVDNTAEVAPVVDKGVGSGPTDTSGLHCR